MKNNIQIISLKKLVFITLITLISLQVVYAQTNLKGGQPPLGSKPSVPNLEEQVLYQRAFEAVIWSIPAIDIHGIRRALMKDVGISSNEFVAMSVKLDAKKEFLTPNNSTLYFAGVLDLQNGPMVLKVPASSNKGLLFGQIIDAWHETIADIGPAGLDAGKGGEYLFLPPNYTGQIPSGYFVVKSSSYRLVPAFRSIQLPGMTETDAFNYSKTIQLYPLSEAANPKPNKFYDAVNTKVSSLPYYDFRYFEELHEIINVEPVRERDKVMMGMLATIGLEKGKPFNPSDNVKAIMTRAVTDAYFYMQQLVQKSHLENPYWPDRHWSDYFAMKDEKGTFRFELDNMVEIDKRAIMYHQGIIYPSPQKKPAVLYLLGAIDSKGAPLEAGKTYRLHVPKDMPAKQFWAINVYDGANWAFIDNTLNRAGLSSYDTKSMKMNKDGSVDIYVGPNEPARLESNWIPTEGKRPFIIVRFYGADEPLFDNTFRMPDLELVD